MELARVIISETNDEQIIILKEAEGNRAFPIVIGIFEAVAIDRNLKQKKSPRPMTHDLIENVIRGLDSHLERIVVSDLRDRTYYAKLVLRRNGKPVEVDSRPSDAIAIAVQMKVPIYVEDRVLEEIARADGNGPDTEPGGFTPPASDDEEGEEDKPDLNL